MTLRYGLVCSGLQLGRVWSYLPHPFGCRTSYGPSRLMQALGYGLVRLALVRYGLLARTYYSSASLSRSIASLI